jgi:peptidoglycan/LPS O-acetylase OafA/YrhL
MPQVQKIFGLDGIRALAVTAVVWHHTHPGYAAIPMTDKGYLGVDVFFVLSGFLITTLLMKEREDVGRISLKDFYIRRSLRIFPLYYAVLILLAAYFLLAPPSSSQRGPFLSELPFHFLYLSNWVSLDSLMAVTWSLSTEEQFYLVWPPLLVWLGRRSLIPLAVVLGISQAVNFGLLDAALADWGMPYERYPILQTTFTPILLGVFLAVGMRSREVGAAIAKFSGRIGLVVAFAAMLFLANMTGDIRGWTRLLFQLAAAWMLAGVVLNPGHRMVKMLEWRPLAYIGVVSYGVYLLHKLVLDLVNRVRWGAELNQPEVTFALCMAGTVVVAAGSYHFFEKPLLRLKGRFRGAP